MTVFVCFKKFNMKNNSGLLWPIAVTFCILFPMLAIRIDVEFAIPIKQYEEMQLQTPIKETHIFNKKLMLGIGKRDHVSVYYFLEDNDKRAISCMPATEAEVLYDSSMTPGIYRQFNKSIVQGIFQYTNTDIGPMKIVIPKGTEIVQVPDI